MNTWKGSFLSIRCLSLVLFLSLLVLQQTEERERERTLVEKEKIRTKDGMIKREWEEVIIGFLPFRLIYESLGITSLFGPATLAV
jgi:hypothetical protein